MILTSNEAATMPKTRLRDTGASLKPDESIVTSMTLAEETEFRTLKSLRIQPEVI